MKFYTVSPLPKVNVPCVIVQKVCEYGRHYASSRGEDFQQRVVGMLENYPLSPSQTAQVTRKKERCQEEKHPDWCSLSDVWGRYGQSWDCQRHELCQGSTDRRFFFTFSLFLLFAFLLFLLPLTNSILFISLLLRLALFCFFLFCLLVGKPMWLNGLKWL